MRNKNILRQLSTSLTLLLIAISVPSNSASAAVSSLSPEVSIDSGTALQIAVQCRSKKGKRFLRKESDGALWCDQISGKFCSGKKIQVARKVCSREYSSTFRQSVTPQADSKLKTAKSLTKKANSEAQKIVALRKEKRDIELKLVEVRERKLELRRREVEIQKQESGMSLD